MLLQQQHIVYKDDHTLDLDGYGNTVNSQCYGCQKWGNLTFNLPDNNNNDQHQRKGHGKNGTSLFQVSVGFSQNEDKYTIPCTWILLNTCSTVSLRYNTYMRG